jgi:altronate hydrolase
VAVATEPLPAGAAAAGVTAKAAIPAGHKLALQAIRTGEAVIKYGWPIGKATQDIAPGDWVHSHNLATALDGFVEYSYQPGSHPREAAGPAPTFQGFRRADGHVGTRNEIWIVNTVGCVNQASLTLARLGSERFAKGSVEGVYAFPHPFGCSQLGDDLKNTQKVLAGLIRHPNAGGVLVLGLGCENNAMRALLEETGPIAEQRVKFFNAQDVPDEIEAGLEKLEELAAFAGQSRRETCPASDLVLGMKCGGSDGFSGITANPLVGMIADRVTGWGGTAILTEVPEMFGAEQLLMDRSASKEVFQNLVDMVNDFKKYFMDHHQPIYENPAPGNKEGGITTLEEKSLGCVQKGGRATVTEVLPYGAPITRKGLALVSAPGNDAVSTTAEVVAGATLLLFTTGRGTPLGNAVPTVKISSNTALAEKKPKWIDFDAGVLVQPNADREAVAGKLMDLVLDIASGRRQARNEINGMREIAIFKTGVTL